MLKLSGDWRIKDWCDWFESLGYEVGRDYEWAWSLEHEALAVKFHDTRLEMFVLLQFNKTMLEQK